MVCLRPVFLPMLPRTERETRMRQAALALAVCGVLLTAACGKDKVAPRAKADVQGALAAAGEAERRRFGELKAKVLAIEPSAENRAKPV